MSNTEDINNSQTISLTEIKELDNYLQSLLNDLDNKVAVLQSQSPPRSNNTSSQEKVHETTSSSRIQYSAAQDDFDPNVTNVVAYEQVKTTEIPSVIVSDILNNIETDQHTLLDDISSINSSKSLFSPVEPDLFSVKNDFTNEQFLDKSIDTISSIDTITRPNLSINSAESLIEGLQTGEVSMDPYFKFKDGMPFHLFDVSQLDFKTTGYVKLGSRSAAYYGEYPYSYSGMSHNPRPFSDNTYLMHILSYIQIVIPDIKFNSVMIHKYSDGNSIMPHHSDNEECIESDTDIITISLGDTRTIEFRNKQSESAEQVTLAHGEVLTMSRTSQNYFSHSILPATTDRGIRLSITLRQIKPNSSNNVTSRPQSAVTDFLYNLSLRANANCNEAGPVKEGEDQTLYDPPHDYQDGYQDGYNPYHDDLWQSPFLESPGPFHQNMPQPPKKKTESAFKPFKSVTDNRQRSQYSWHREGWQPPERSLPQRIHPQRSAQPRQPLMFPPEQVHPSRNIAVQQQNNFDTHAPQIDKDEVVFISSSMFADLDALKLSTNMIKSHVFFYRGADAHRMMEKLKTDAEVQNLRKNRVSKVFILTGTNNVDPVCHQRQSIQDSCHSISKTISYVQSLFPAAVVNVMNILPRVQENRKNVINQLNRHIKQLCEQNTSNKLQYIDTYSMNLFNSPNGVRKTELFKYMFRNDLDNVHLNNYGIVKLGKHLKYLAHR